MKKLYKMDDFITANHVDAVCRILVFISLIMGTAYITEIFIAWYSGSEYEVFTFFRNRITGEYAYQFWFMFIFNALLPQLFWSKKVRHNIWIVFAISICINIGMWLERYIIIVTSLTKDFLPANSAEYHAYNGRNWFLCRNNRHVFSRRVVILQIHSANRYS